MPYFEDTTSLKGLSKFDDLVTALRDALGSSGLTCDDIDLDFLMDLMKTYTSNEKEWKAFALANPSMAYTRNLVDEGNGKSNLLVLVWTPGKGSPIHSHSNAHCLMKILKGSLTETRYDFPQESNREIISTPLDDRNASMDVALESVYTENDVAYMSDDQGVHKMWNNSDKFAVSLHLYTPPNIVRNGCYVFNADTGKGTLVKNCEYYSVRGHRLDGLVRETEAVSSLL
ncbi:cysteine dioxygenase [Colletotrichum phormii]|uniref:Cysteine dioxygenase n=1 Tax=Colletotrichum phormii TaxID=359342 RepID=A0AAI9ZCI5_9PEZI|nr:cysteine dioxygenase [Colletotrichum phormii]KAK1622017.1 cysteine dioxygenase [Colletotrichum phormii]